MRTAELIFPSDFDQRSEWEAEQRGLLDYVKVRIDGMRIYDVCFFTPDRIAGEAALLLQAGEPWLAYPGLILVPAVTRDAMQKAVSALAQTDHFSQLTPNP